MLILFDTNHKRNRPSEEKNEAVCKLVDKFSDGIRNFGAEGKNSLEPHNRPSSR